MPIGGYLIGAYNADVIRQKLIEHHRHLIRRDRRIDIKYGNISEGMNPRIRTTCPDHLDRSADRFFHSLREHAFNRDSFVLDLPAVIRRSVI